MTPNLLAHIATSEEPIPALSGHPDDGPDLRETAPIEQMREWLDALSDDEAGYIALWRRLMLAAGCTMLAHRDATGERCLMLGGRADAQFRHRSRWSHFLYEDLDRVPGRRDALLDALERAGWEFDERPVRPRETTAAIRAFLSTGGRLMIDPDGRLYETGDVAKWARGTDAEAAQIAAGSRAYSDARHRYRADKQIRRAVCMLGHLTHHGWIVLDAKGRTPAGRWDATKAAYSRARAISDGLADDDAAADNALDAYCIAMDRLILVTPAPDVTAVAEKMAMAISRGPDDEVLRDYAAAILADLTRLASEIPA